VNASSKICDRVGFKLLALGALFFLTEIVVFKFLADLSTAVVQHTASPLIGFDAYRDAFMPPDSVFRPRFLGTEIVWWIASLIHIHSNDIRLSPLRLAVGITSPLYLSIGIAPVMRSSRYSWAIFYAGYLAIGLVSQFGYAPWDLPSFAFESVSLFYVLEERFICSFLWMLVAGLFRESSLHVVWFVACWWLANLTGHDRVSSLRSVVVFLAGFVLEYVAIRYFFPSPMRAPMGSIYEIFFGGGVVSLTTICTLGFAVLFPIGYLCIADRESNDWREKFFRYNCYAFPGWILFYRVMSGNLSEFRIFLPVLLPIVYGFAWKLDVSLRDRPIEVAQAMTEVVVRAE
jgi:hypothetical protein